MMSRALRLPLRGKKVGAKLAWVLIGSPMMTVHSIKSMRLHLNFTPVENS